VAGAVTDPATWSGSRLTRLAGVAVALWALLYLWPLADGASDDSFATIDHLLRLIVTALASGASLLAALRAPAGQRWPWLVLALGANVWAATQAVRWGYELSRAGSAPADLAELGYAAFGLSAVAALGSLVVPRSDASPGRRALDAALLGVPVVLVSWTTGIGAVLTGSGSDGITLLQLVLRLLVDIVLVGLVCALLSGPRARAPAVVVLGTGLLVVAVVDTAVIGLAARGEVVPDRLVGAVLCAALTVFALGVVGLSAAPDDDTPADDDQAVVAASPLPAVLPAVAGAVVLGTVVAGEALEALEVGLLVVLGVLSLLRQHLVGRDAAERLRRLSGTEAEMRHLAFHDELTSLANRALFHDRLEHALALHRRYRRPLVVLFCDLDDFKAVNDVHGHLAGDEMLRDVAARLATTLRPADTFARLGGDEFAVLLEDDADAAAVVRRMRGALETPFVVDGTAVKVGMTIGIARVDAADATPEADALLARADADMYAAKRSSPGRRRMVPLQEPPRAAARAPEGDRVESVLDALARDVRAGALDVVYQPLVDPVTGEVRGLEALARWSYAGQPVLPDMFIPLAVRGGLIAPLTDLVLDRACAQLRAWSRALQHDRLTVSVNLASEQLLDRAFPQRVTEILTRHGVGRDQLVLEITADALVEDPLTAYAVCTLLREAGVLLSLAELGVDPVALGHLHRLPLDSIKVDGDGDVVIDVGTEERVVRAFSSLARELDLRMVVEGVERAEQLAVLRKIGGMLVQGFLLARPMPAAQLDEMVLNGLSLPD
jgi:diguanylate cyclase (GGDEF)-like protein